MARKATQSFNCPPLEQLTRQLLYAPADKRIDQIRRAERLHDEIDSASVYPQDYVIYRITGIAAVKPSETLLVGEAVLPDLRMIIDQLSHSVEYAPAHSNGDDPTESSRELAERLKVSTKTIARWRKIGLRWRWMMIDGRKEIRFPLPGVERFVHTHSDRVTRAASFSQLDALTRDRLIERARRIAQVRDVSLNQVAAHLARRVGRALETIRLILEQHDAQNTEDPIFANRSGPLDPEQKDSIARAYETGVSVTRIARLFGRTRSTIYRAIHERRAISLRKRPIQFLASPLFERDDADEVILRAEEPDKRTKRPKASVDELPESMRKLFTHQPLQPEHQRSLWIRMHYLRYKAARLVAQLDQYEPRVTDMDRIDSLLEQADDVRDRLVASNLPTVLTVARAHMLDLPPVSERIASGYLVNMLETGIEILIESARDHDPFGRTPFEKHLSWILARRFASDGAGDAADNTPLRAHRREDPEIVLQRIRDHAGTAGIKLPDGAF